MLLFYSIIGKESDNIIYHKSLINLLLSFVNCVAPNVQIIQGIQHLFDSSLDNIAPVVSICNVSSIYLVSVAYRLFCVLPGSKFQRWVSL